MGINRQESDLWIPSMEQNMDRLSLLLKKKNPFINIKTIVRSCVLTHERHGVLKVGNVRADGLIWTGTSLNDLVLINT